MINEGRGTHETFDYLPFSDPDVLRELITNRIRLDEPYQEKVYPSGCLSSNGGMIFNESIIAAYIDLDRLIEATPLSRKQRAVINLLMRGYTIQDIADETGNDQRNISHLFSRAIRSLVEHHNTRWLMVMTGEAREDN